ncbi:phage tail protein [Xenorhabdus sp. XENO-10]|uniref:Phage tail protein n=1 Tax=Xenorhabdus yunnanensis TaxID=3025878 RepID=A0ABT5LJU6_9GAMM|nr:phage tail protein [Xenorhabdus yunnanensis]MDC9590758.1 phage tail protein [Xenorhabdus yunnanensis]
MGIFSGVGKELGYNNLSSFGKAASNNFISKVLERSTSMLSGNYGSAGRQSTEIRNAKSLVYSALRIRYAQGWQWAIEADGLNGLDMFAKDITYDSITIETESKQIGAVVFNKPTHREAGTITITVRDSEDGAIARWFDERADRVTNGDGTVNIPSQYAMGIRIYRVMQSGGIELDSEFDVFPTSRGETTRSRDQVTEFLSYPLTFIKTSSIKTTNSSIIGGTLSKATHDAVSSNNIIKF